MSTPQAPEAGTRRTRLTDTELRSLIDYYLRQFTASSVLEAISRGPSVISGLLELEERRRDDRRPVERVPKDGGDR